MRLPLIVAASPARMKEGPRVFLRAGKWKVDHNVSDTKFRIITEVLGMQKEYTKDSSIFSEVFCAAYAVIDKPGTEDSISIDLVMVS